MILSSSRFEPSLGDIAFIQVDIHPDAIWSGPLRKLPTSPCCAACGRSLTWAPMGTPYGEIPFCVDCRHRGRPLDVSDPDDVGGSG